MHITMYVFYLHAYTYIAPTPRIFLIPNHLQQGINGETHDLICLITLSSTASSISVNLTWNFISYDSRVTVIPTNITIDDSIGIIYTTVIQFAYLIEEDESNYTCTLTIENSVEKSIFILEIISKLRHKFNIQAYAHIHAYICTYLQKHSYPLKRLSN